MIILRLRPSFRNLLSVVIFSVCIQAQAAEYFEPGYIVRYPKDTVRGLVMIKEHAFNTRNCVFKETAEGKEVTYMPGDIVAYGTVNKTFRSYLKSSPDSDAKKIFIEAILIGKISLFFNDDSFFIADDDSIEALVEVKKEIVQDERVFRVKQPLYRSTLLNALKDCPTIHNDVVHTTLNRKALMKLLRTYHTCIGASAKETVPEDEIAIRWGLSFGAMYSELQWQSGYSPDYLFMEVTPYPSTVSFTPSVWAEIWRPGLNRLRMRIGTNYYAATYHGTFQSSLSGLGYDFTLAISRIDLALQLKYLLFRKGPYVFGGASVGKILSWDDKLIIRTYPGDVFVKENTSLIMNELVVQIGGGLGIELPVASRSIIFEADTRLTLTGISKSIVSTPILNILGFTLSAGFPLNRN